MTETVETEHLETPTPRVTVVNFAHVRCFISFVTVLGQFFFWGGSYRGITLDESIPVNKVLMRLSVQLPV